MLGRAVGHDQTCIFTLYNLKNQSTTKSKVAAQKSLLNTAVHEVMHIFGMDHCSFFKCAMNAGGTFDTLSLCPICLAKLHHSLSCFNVKRRYDTLASFYDRYGFKLDAKQAKAAAEAVAIQD